MTTMLPSRRSSSTWGRFAIREDGEFVDPASDHAAHKHDGWVGLVRGGEQRAEVGVGADEDAVVVAGGAQDNVVARGLESE
ncbi:hypothetical protein PA7_34130 [Pseudonocardia asaccharolytica DSM 44247 = NBRC 16224]|uniref:Uncharacterized protein n=1 Tax=Pseudonocardia asaccharolytica DSM 44247 = NBRC 16224 TaxID=1123024 RepID=A0A511D447_9PSEU|nr:hypothetical protein [Pseudonocardia asaccharolytica]GEL19576.1 hypothetical protein PA7_34130 [Pseudonocardia asaccharolytica DSM 44247 = NBRC 16224]